MPSYSRTRTATGWCEWCGKLMYNGRKIARSAARRHSDHKSAYPCPHNPLWWHIGALPVDIVRGHLTRDEFFGRAE
jgi:hypothetical protein